jgi:hypothetical protein
MYENRVLRRIFGPKREEVAGIWRKLHDYEFHNFCSSPSVTEVMKSGRICRSRHVACMGEMRNIYV